MTKSNIDSLLNSGEYKIELSKTLTSLLSKVKSADSEASISSIFEIELHGLIKSFFDKDILFTKEVGGNSFRHKFIGRIDAISNDLIIEYKKGSKLKKEIDKENATNQVKIYLDQIKNETTVESQAILTDGEKIRYFYYKNGNLYYSPFKNIDIDDIDKVVRSLIYVRNKKFVPQNIVDDFKLNSNSNYSKNLANILFEIINQNISGKTDMLFQEWEVLFHLSEQDKGQNQDIIKRREVLGKIFNTTLDDTESDYKALYVLQTTYAIIIKLIACKVISKLAFNNNIMYFSDLSKINSDQFREFIEKLEDGYIYTTGIRNLLEGDFFSWYCAKEQWNNKLFDCIISIVNLLEEYTNVSFTHGYAAIDIFKDLYMEIIPNEVRHSLGEYFTPSWLADYIVKESSSMLKIDNWKGIDPCCGSGIFVLSMIKNIIGDTDLFLLDENQKNDLLFSIISRVQGVDINPLSVLTARVSYVLAISPLLTGKKVEVPIYLGDSANIPNRLEVSGVPCYEYIVSTKQGNIDVILPCEFVHNKIFLEKMSLLQNTIKAENSDLVYAKIVDNIDENSKKPKVLKLLKNLSETLVQLHQKNWDGIWIRIVTNFMLVARINNIDLIIGNPPWVKWEFLPQLYAEKIKSLCVQRHLFSGQTYMGAISLNICALISNVTASTWLNKNGLLSFLMPKTLMTQDSYAGFRNFYINVAENERLYLQKIDDWSKSGDPFICTKEKFLTYYYQANKVDYTKGIPIKNIIKNKNVNIKEVNWLNEFQDMERYFSFTNGIAYQLDKNRTGFTIVNDASKTNNDFSIIIGKSDYKARSGVEFTPAEIYFIEPMSKSSKEETYIFKNSKFKNSIYKAKFNDGFELETKYIKPVIKSPNIKEFHIENNTNYCIFPYDKLDTNSIPLEKMNLDSEYLAHYLIDNKKTIGKQSKRSLMISKGSDFYSLSKVGKYTFFDYAVVFRDNTKLVASVVTKKPTPWGTNEMPICAKHSPYISMDNNNEFISENEAYYLAGILNTEIVQEYFKSTFSTRSYSIDFNIKLPKLNEKNATQKKIIDLSKKAHGNFEDQELVNAIKIEIQLLYMELCKS